MHLTDWIGKTTSGGKLAADRKIVYSVLTLLILSYVVEG
jgi:hypothetical protein